MRIRRPHQHERPRRQIQASRAGQVLDGLIHHGGRACKRGPTIKPHDNVTTWSYPNLAGHFATTTDNNGLRVGQVVVYDPYGAEIPGVPQPMINNSLSPNDQAAFGASGKQSERIAGPPLVFMGARPYAPSQGRFLAVDPVEGGCANAYVYVAGDPLNASDLTGQSVFSAIGHAFKKTACAIRNNIPGAIGVGLGIAAIGLVTAATLGADIPVLLTVGVGAGGVFASGVGATRAFNGRDGASAGLNIVGGELGVVGTGYGVGGKLLKVASR